MPTRLHAGLSFKGITMTAQTGTVDDFAAYAAIAATLQQYVDAARAGDSTAMRRAFVAGASIRGSYGGARSIGHCKSSAR